VDGTNLPIIVIMVVVVAILLMLGTGELAEPVSFVDLFWDAVILVWPYARDGLLLILILRAI